MNGFFFLVFAMAMARRRLYLVHEVSSAFDRLLGRCPGDNYEKYCAGWTGEWSLR